MEKETERILNQFNSGNMDYDDFLKWLGFSKEFIDNAVEALSKAQ